MGEISRCQEKFPGAGKFCPVPGKFFRCWGNFPGAGEILPVPGKFPGDRKSFPVPIFLHQTNQSHNALKSYISSTHPCFKYMATFQVGGVHASNNMQAICNWSWTLYKLMLWMRYSWSAHIIALNPVITYRIKCKWEPGSLLVNMSNKGWGLKFGSRMSVTEKLRLETAAQRRKQITTAPWNEHNTQHKNTKKCVNAFNHLNAHTVYTIVGGKRPASRHKLWGEGEGTHQSAVPGTWRTPASRQRALTEGPCLPSVHSWPWYGSFLAGQHQPV